MTELATSLRNQLSKTIVSARREAESGARAALHSLAVERHEPHSEMTLEQRQLRNRLRAHGRQLGDRRDRVRGDQSIDRLAHEVAYAHWHRMLFARFLAENHLLIHPDVGASVSLEDIRELAHEANENPNAMAARFAQQNLPQIFRTDDPVLEVPLAPNVDQKLIKLLDSLPSGVFTADDSLGWTYQYWQSEKKDEVNAAGDKIGADELPAVTQLFTEHYMVLFLYHNTIGAWHAGKVLAEKPELATNASSEEELRAACALNTSAGEKNWEYLRFVRELKEGDEDGNPSGPWRPAAGTFESWPASAKELKVLDPCCGSGHFLVVGFKLLVGLRMHEEGLGLEDAIRSALADNLFGLELDQRCTQIAAFNVAMAAWKLAGRPIELPSLNIACSGLSIGSSKKEWVALGEEDPQLQNGMTQLYELFRLAPELGSLIDPGVLGNDLFEASFDHLKPLLKKALANEVDDSEKFERAITAQSMSKTADLLAGEYHLVITNVPYLGRGQQCPQVKELADNYYSAGKADLATIFLQRAFSWLADLGTVAIVAPQPFLFLTSYKNLRELLLNERTLNLVARLGPGAFQSISGEVVNVALNVFSASRPVVNSQHSSLDVSRVSGTLGKASALSGNSSIDESETNAAVRINLLKQSDQALNPDSRILFRAASSGQLLLQNCESFLGLGTGDINKYIRNSWELIVPATSWSYYQRPVKRNCTWGGADSVVAWDSSVRRVAGMSDEERYQIHNQDQSGQQAWGRPGISVSLMGTLRASLYTGTQYDKGTTALIPTPPDTLAALFCFCQDEEFNDTVREVDANVMCSSGAVVKVPFDLSHWEKVADEKYPNGLPRPYSEDATQWLFHGHPAACEENMILQVAVGRLLDYQWPAELDSSMELAEHAREWVRGCEKLRAHADGDGIVCLSATRGEVSAAARLRKLLAAALGAKWSASYEKGLLAKTSGDKRPPASLEAWLRDKFFEQHCRMFQNRPFLWHIWDGHKDGFHCLINAHKLTGSNGEGRKTLELITYSYLKDWIDRQREDQQNDIDGADAKLMHALDMQAQLEKILEGESPYDLFVRWKPLHEQAIGWEPDINDGVRLNIRPFMKAELRKGGKKGAGILRAKPNIKWSKDRGKDPERLRPKEDFPWFWGGNGDSKEPTSIRTDYTLERAARAGFDGNRWNDLHYTRAVKITARVAHKNREADS